LHDLYGGIVIPEEVRRELIQPGNSNPGAIEVLTEPWITTRSVTNIDQVRSLLQQHDDLDIGEAEAIILALELGADLLLVDEGVGRRVAAELEIPNTGVLGMLLDAKERGMLNAVKPVLDDLIHEAGFYVGSSLYTYILDLAGE
jgi:uncharacterized protein